MKKAVLILVCGALVFSLTLSTASAIPPFAAEFKARYVKENPETDEEKALAAAVEKVKCNVCHMGKEKKERNAYGKALDELLDKKEDAKNKEKIQEALEAVEEMKADEDGPTFGELIKEGKLPGGEE